MHARIDHAAMAARARCVSRPELAGIPYGVPYSIPGHAILLDRPPVQSVESIQYQDMAGAWQTMPSTDYVAELQSAPARITPGLEKSGRSPCRRSDP